MKNNTLANMDCKFVDRQFREGFISGITAIKFIFTYPTVW